MYCQNCGTRLDDTAVTCVHCGQPTGVKAKKAGLPWPFWVLLGAAVVVGVVLIVVIFGKEEPAHDTAGVYGVSDGTFSFTCGNIQFTVPNETHYTLATSGKENQLSVTLCSFNIGESVISITCDNIGNSPENEVVEETIIWDYIRKDHAREMTYLSSTDLLVAGEKVSFDAFTGEAESNICYTATFSDGSYVYTIEIKFIGYTESAEKMGEMLAGSMYVGKKERFNFYQ